ncbi:hypothetical protein PFICI_06054 [Pestalotiopsis fici W106-1]|uniref:CBM-cenC domain-containing protein n=1 Tax=Pestalotiopsis fici (strain W106-1 / CGMCC3.15140) TaxID=1229662 RepID=W3X6M2_PESFW|nr:uncharacterized protein PFICI_06054 [Pestalotiopsis fici W106-1]ETS81052.1 hypothetical protein PFICI_06054 [Pestalotiopsis fici W106-1]
MYALFLTIALWFTLAIAQEPYPEEYNQGAGRYHYRPGAGNRFTRPHYPFLDKPPPGIYQPNFNTVTVTTTVTLTITSASTSTSTSDSTSTSSSTSTSTTPASTNLVINGGFEALGGSLPPWIASTTGNTTTYQEFAGLTQPGSNSANAARAYVTNTGLSQSAGAQIAQPIALVTGSTYTVSYEYSILDVQPDGNGEYLCRFISYYGGTVLQNTVVSSPSGFQTYTTSFVADGLANSLTIGITCPAGLGNVAIDNVSVVAAT